jgi:hypothetical protein
MLSIVSTVDVQAGLCRLLGCTIWSVTACVISVAHSFAKTCPLKGSATSSEATPYLVGGLAIGQISWAEVVPPDLVSLPERPTPESSHYPGAKVESLVIIFDPGSEIKLNHSRISATLSWRTSEVQVGPR